MHDSKLIALISTFSIEDKRKLRKWIKSDFVNKNTDIISFFQFIDTRSTLTAKTLSKEKAHLYMYPNLPYQDLRIRHLIWQTTEIVEQFIIYNKVTQQPALSGQLLAQYYTDNELYKFAEQSTDESLTLIQQSKLQNASYHLYQYHIQALSFHIQTRKNRSEVFNLQKVIDHATIFSVIETLKYACVVQSMQKITEANIDIHLLDTTLKLIHENSLFLHEISIRVYYNTYLMIKDESEQAYEQLIDDIKSHSSFFSISDLRDLYMFAISFCVKKSNQNIARFTRETFELYIYTIQNGILLENKVISRFSFTNVVTLGIKLKEFTATEEFIKQYAKLISKEFQKNTIDFNNAKLLFAKGNYQKALQILLTNEFKDILWELNSKYIVLKIFFETKDIIRFPIFLKAFKNFIKRKSNIGYHKNYFVNVSIALTQLKELQQKPAMAQHFKFDASTPDIDWFNKALASMQGSKKQNKKADTKPTLKK